MPSAPLADAPNALRRQQFTFAAHLRDPQTAPAPEGIENRRMAIYRELFFNNINDLLSANFPVIRGLYADADWHRVVRDFYREHRCQTPIFSEVAKEFLRYLELRREQQRGDPDFLLELAHYEWVELALSLDDNPPSRYPLDPEGDLLDGVPVLSAQAWPLAYRYPVHRIGRDYQPDSEPGEPTFLLVVRDSSDRVRFKEINAMVFQLIQTIAANEADVGRQLLSNMAAAGGQEVNAFVTNGGGMLRQLRERDVILGTRRHS